MARAPRGFAMDRTGKAKRHLFILIFAALIAAGSFSILPCASAQNIVRREFYFHGGGIGGLGIAAGNVEGTMNSNPGDSEKIALMPGPTGSVASLENDYDDVGYYTMFFISDEPLAEDLVVFPGLCAIDDANGAGWNVAGHIGVELYVQAGYRDDPTGGYIFNMLELSIGLFEIKSDGTRAFVAYTPKGREIANSSITGFAGGTYHVQYEGDPKDPKTTYTFSKGSKIAVGVLPTMVITEQYILFGYDSEKCPAKIWFDIVPGGFLGKISMGIDHTEKKAHAGDNVSYEISIANNCGISQEVELKISGAPFGWNASLAENRFSIAHNESRKIALSVEVPGDAVEGDRAEILVEAKYDTGPSSIVSTTVVVPQSVETGLEAGARNAPGIEASGIIAAICAVAATLWKRT